MMKKHAIRAGMSLDGHIPYGNLQVLRGHPAAFTRQPGWFPQPAGATIDFSSSAVPTGRHEADGGADRHGWTAVRPCLWPARSNVLPPQERPPAPCDVSKGPAPSRKAHPISGVDGARARLSLYGVTPSFAPTGVTAPWLEMCVNTTLRLGRSFSRRSTAPCPTAPAASAGPAASAR
jgi:hypothetical protein